MRKLGKILDAIGVVGPEPVADRVLLVEAIERFAAAGARDLQLARECEAYRNRETGTKTSFYA